MPSTRVSEVALLEVRLDRHLILLHLDDWRMVGLAVLFVSFQGVGEISGNAILQLLQNTNYLAALRVHDCRDSRAGVL